MTLTIPEGDSPLPSGYHYGAILTPPGNNGYYIVRESDGRSCVGWMHGECTTPPTADEIDDAIVAAEVSR